MCLFKTAYFAIFWAHDLVKTIGRSLVIYVNVSEFPGFTTIVRSSSIGIQLKKITFYIGKILYLRKRYWIPCTCLPKSFILHVVHLLWIYIYCLQYLNIEHLQTNTYFVEEMLMDTAGEGGKIKIQDNCSCQVEANILCSFSFTLQYWKRQNFHRKISYFFCISKIKLKYFQDTHLMLTEIDLLRVKCRLLE